LFAFLIPLANIVYVHVFRELEGGDVAEAAGDGFEGGGEET
jgi:hypothetical protein